MKQLLLRVDDSLHSELAARARGAGTSVNALANELLSLGVGASANSRRFRLRARLLLTGEVGRGAVTPGALGESRPGLRQRAIESMIGAGALIDDILAAERSR
ncbi:MAG: toxin-antitoxin system HicB family antitoxin [Actinomycetota bacterium]